MELGATYGVLSLILLGGLILVSLGVPIIDSAILCSRTHNCRPLVDSTLGQFVAS